MAGLTLYGSSVADATLTTACDMATTVGGSETSKLTVMTGTNHYAEIFSKGSAGTAGASSIPATPTGNGWVYQPGFGLFAASNWFAQITISSVSWGGSSLHTSLTLRFFRYDGSTSTLIGSIVMPVTSISRTVYTFAPTAMPATFFSSGDWLYCDLWWFDDNGNIGGDNPTIYLSSSASQGVPGDFQVTTPNFVSPPVVLVSALTRDGHMTAVVRDGLSLTTTTRG